MTAQRQMRYTRAVQSTALDVLNYLGRCEVLKYQPTNEQGVVFLFALVCSRLGYQVQSIRTEFPDALLRDRDGKVVRCEFEYLTHNFVRHKHPIDECDLVVAWEDDYFLRREIQVIELKRYFPELERDPEHHPEDAAINKTDLILRMTKGEGATKDELEWVFSKYHQKERAREPVRLIARLIEAEGEPYVDGGRLRLAKKIKRATGAVSDQSDKMAAAEQILQQLGINLSQ